MGLNEILSLFSIGALDLGWLLVYRAGSTLPQAPIYIYMYIYQDSLVAFKHYTSILPAYQTNYGAQSHSESNIISVFSRPICLGERYSTMTTKLLCNRYVPTASSVQCLLESWLTASTQIILASSDTEYLDQLIPALKDATNSNRTAGLMHGLSQYADEREADIERIGLTKHEEFLDSVNQLQRVREGTVSLTAEILKLNESIQESTEKLAAQKEALVDTKAIRQNIAEASEALKESLKILHAVNGAHELIKKKKYYGALKALDDLQNEHLIPTIQNKYATQHKLADIIQKSIPASQRAISEAVMTDLNTWLYRIRETSQFLGEVAFYHTELRRTRQKERMESNEFLRAFKLNSAIELVFDESEEFDVLDNDELQVDFTPLFECLHIHEALGQSDKFRVDFAATRRRQKELLLPTSVNLVDENDDASLSSLLEGIAGFAIIEKATMRRTQNLRSSVDVSKRRTLPRRKNADISIRLTNFGTPCATVP